MMLGLSYGSMAEAKKKKEEKSPEENGEKKQG